MVYTVALTGGIGSGKSTVANAFSRLGVAIVDADLIARQVVEPRTAALHAITDRFGDEICLPDGTLNRRMLREKIFADPTDKAWLNGLLHPLISQRTRDELVQTTSPYALWVVPLLVENKLNYHANRVLVIDVTPQMQLSRTVLRDNVTQELASKMLTAQATRAERLAVADDVIDNNGTPEHIISEVARLHQQYLRFATQSEQENE